MRHSTLRIISATSVLICLLGCGPDRGTADPNPSATTQTTKTDESAGEPHATKLPELANITLQGPAQILKKTYGEWSMATAPRYFGPDNLYDLINGGSEIFVGYGFKQIATQDYKNKSRPNVTITVEVYDMGTPLGAFGRVSKYLDNMVTPGDAGKKLPEGMAERGILGDGDLVFWKEKYLVHLTLLDENPEATIESITKLSDEAVPAIGKAIYDAIPNGEDVEKTILTRFPADFQLKRSLAFHYSFSVGEKNIRAFSCRYQTDAAQWQLFMSETAAENATVQETVDVLKKSEDVLAVKKINGFVVGALKTGDAGPTDAQLNTQFMEMEKSLTAADSK
ncbi:MAG: hypothetical protein JXX29_16670 [Deltaproteobacteria bacterium]|nr:hypothetical protein [Deltaproteobacteria bacterium]MBN2673319.1 hypothetical protein [Deltaproteobacteria bacterium]